MWLNTSIREDGLIISTLILLILVTSDSTGKDLSLSQLFYLLSRLLASISP